MAELAVSEASLTRIQLSRENCTCNGELMPDAPSLLKARGLSRNRCFFDQILLCRDRHGSSLGESIPPACEPVPLSRPSLERLGAEHVRTASLLHKDAPPVEALSPRGISSDGTSALNRSPLSDALCHACQPARQASLVSGQCLERTSADKQACVAPSADECTPHAKAMSQRIGGGSMERSELHHLPLGYSCLPATKSTFLRPRQVVLLRTVRKIGPATQVHMSSPTAEALPPRRCGGGLEGKIRIVRHSVPAECQNPK